MAVPPPTASQLPSLVGYSGDSMNFNPKPILEESAVFYFDAKKKEGIEFHGPDTYQYQQFQIETGRAIALAKRTIMEQGETDDDVKGQIQTIILSQAWVKSLPKVFKAAHKITLGDEAVTADNARELFRAMTRDQIIMCGNFVSQQESFLGKQ